MSNFEVIDRRKEKQESPTTEVIAVPESQPAADTSSWKNVGYMIVLVPSNAGPIVTGRAVGLRSDGLCFCADYFLPQIYPEHFDWTAKARERLDTWLGCECARGTRCTTHKMYMPQWLRADTDRLELIGNSAIPEAIEIMFKAERARAAGSIVVPR